MLRDHPVGTEISLPDGNEIEFQADTPIELHPVDVR